MKNAIEIFKKHGAYYYENDEQSIIDAMEEYAALQAKNRKTMYTFTIIHENKVFYSNYFDVENLYVRGMIVINNINDTFFDGKNWQEIEEDHL
jgi:hypothetical protein